jgi:predicted transcriptional regulator
MSRKTTSTPETADGTGDPECNDALPEGVVLDATEDDIDSRLQLRDQLSEDLADTEFGDSVVLPLDAARELTKDHLREVVDHLRENEVESVSQLADELGVDRGNMSRYLDTLLEYDIVTVERVGKKKRPRLKYEHIVFEPLY